MAGGERGPQKLLTAERQRRIIELRRKRYSFEEIGKKLGLSTTMVWKHYQNYCKTLPAPELDQHRKEMLAQLDEAEKAVLRILHGKNFRVTANGKIVFLNNLPVKDPDYILKAAQTLVRIQERKSRLLGADMEQKSKPETNVTYKIFGVDPKDLT